MRTSQYRIIVVCLLLATINLVGQDYRWSLAGALKVGRHWHRTEAMLDGRLLVIGGIVGSTKYVDGAALDGMSTNACEIYDPVRRTTVDAAAMNIPRSEFPSVVTPDGKVLVFGGLTGESERGPCTSTIEEYDPASDTWTIVGSLSLDRRRHTAIMIDDRRVLIAGGCPTDRIAVPRTEIYDVVDRTTTVVGELPQKLKEGSLAIVQGVPVYVGGREGGPNSTRQIVPYAFDTTELAWQGLSGWGMPAISTSVTLDDGTLVVCGGNLGESPANFSRAVYHVHDGVSENVLTMEQERTLHAMVSMGGRSVLVSGGVNNDLEPLSTTLLIDVETDQLLVKPDHVFARAYHNLIRIEHPEEGTTFYAISGMVADRSLTNTIEKLSIGSEAGLIANVTSVHDDQGAMGDVYPNPCADRVNVIADMGTPMRLLDWTGRLVSDALATTAGVSSVNVEHIPGGAYQLVYMQHGRVTSATVIKR